jgi:hypothetical protein
MDGQIRVLPYPCCAHNYDVIVGTCTVYRLLWLGGPRDDDLAHY